MKTVLGSKKVWRVAGLAAVMLAGALFVGVPAAAAAGPEPVADDAGFFDLALQRAYEREQMALDHLGDRLAFNRTIAGDVAAWIEHLRAEGEDVSDLEAALAAFNAGLDQAQAHYDTAAAILAEHAGFDDSGAVTSRPQAIKTLRDAGRALRDANRALGDAVYELHWAIRDWRAEHRGQQVPLENLP
jgi:hypothetical protein